MNDNILKLMGKLSLAKALIESANLSVYDVLDGHRLGRLSLDEKTTKTINRVLSDIDFSKDRIDEVIFGLSTELL